jgi:hypothetical protein
VALFSFPLLLLVNSACGPSSQELAPTIIAQTDTARQLSTAVVAQALSIVLTDMAPPKTPTSTLTPTLRPTATPSPNPWAEVIAEAGFLWSGPGAPFEIIVNANQGDQFEAIGWSLDGEWLVVLLESGEPAWIAAEQIQIGEQAAGLPVITPPPRPTPLPMFALTVVTERGDVKLTIHSTGKTYQLSEHNVHRLTIPGGWQTLTYSWSLDERANCTTTIYIDHDIQWRPPPSALQFCASLPGGKNV